MREGPDLSPQPVKTGRKAESRAVEELLRRGRNYRELRRDHNLRGARGDFHTHPTGQAALQQIWLAIQAWRRRWRERIEAQGRTYNVRPAQGPWTSECSGEGRMEVTRNSRFLKACLELAWSHENRWDTQAARLRVQQTACRLPTLGNVRQARRRRQEAGQQGRRPARGQPTTGDTDDTTNAP